MAEAGLQGMLARVRERAGRGAALMNRIAGWNFIACACFITFDVIARRFLGFSSRATTEITGYMLAFGVAWGLAHALAMRAHIRIDVLVNRLPLRVRMALHALALALLTAMAVACAWFAWLLVLESLEFSATDNSALSVPMVLPQGLWALGISAFAALAGLMLVETLLLVARGDANAVDALLGPRSYQDETRETLAAVGVAPPPP